MNIAPSMPRFAVVGIASTFIHVIVAILIIEKMHWHPSIANGIAFITANFFSYTANTFWSFNAKIGMRTWYRFFTVSFVALLLAMAISWLVLTAGGSYLLGTILVVMVVPFISYIGHQVFTYHQ